MAFNLPVQNFFSRRIEPDAWVRPSDWPVITDAPNQVQFLFADIVNPFCTIEVAFNRVSGSQNLIIDWGDGTSNTVTTATNTKVNKQYTPGTGTPCSRGYTTFVIRIYFTGTGVSTLDTARITTILLPGNSVNTFVQCPVLEAYYGDGTINGVYIGGLFFTGNVSAISAFNYLEYVKLPATLNSNSLLETFSGCTSLAVVIMPTSMPNLTSLSSTFSSCFQLRSIRIPANATNINTCSSAFQGCALLSSITLPPTLNSCTNFALAFFNCSSLKNFTMPSINVATTANSMFSNCTSLEWVKFTSMPLTNSPTTLLWSSVFQGSTNLQNVYFPDSMTGTGRYNLGSFFSSCSNLKHVKFPNGLSASSLASAFQSCLNLKSVIFQSGMPNLTDMSTLFSGCANLISVRLPDSVSASGVTLANTFSTCTALKEVTIPDNYLVTSLASTFNSCSSLKKIYWQPGVQNSLTTMSSTYSSCLLLESFPLPTSMTLCNNMSATFSTCRQLKSLTLPSSLNAVTTISSAFGNCSRLESITMPTSMSACTDFTSTFQGCFNLRTIVLPQTISSAINIGFQNAFQSCNSLTSVTFPSAAQLSNITSISGMFASCTNIKTLINFNRIGSLGATPLVNAAFGTPVGIEAISFSCPLSSFTAHSQNAGFRNNTQSVRFLNTSAGQWTASSPQINVSHTNMSTAQLVQLFNDMAAQGNVVSKTINITGATGVAGLTAANRQIITTRGWTITG